MCRYFKQTWITGSFTLRMWNHVDIYIGPRTTNLAKGWHNSLNYTRRTSHISPRSFLQWLQKTAQYEVQCRQLRLDASRSAKQRSRIYRKLDKGIAKAAKLQFSLRMPQNGKDLPWFVPMGLGRPGKEF